MLALVESDAYRLGALIGRLLGILIPVVLGVVLAVRWHRRGRRLGWLWGALIAVGGVLVSSWLHISRAAAGSPTSSSQVKSSRNLRGSGSAPHRVCNPKRRISFERTRTSGTRFRALSFGMSSRTMGPSSVW